MSKRIVTLALVLIFASVPLAAFAKGGGGGGHGATGGSGTSGKDSVSTKGPGSERETGDAKNSGKTIPVNSSAKPDESSAAKKIKKVKKV